MRILQVVKTNRGAAWAYNQANWLCQNGAEVITVLPDENDGYAQKYKASGMKVVRGDWSLPLSKPWIFFKRIKEIKKQVKETAPDLIHLHFVTNVIMGRLALRGVHIPRLFQVPGPLHLESPVFNFAERRVSTRDDYWAGACIKTCDIYKEKGIDEKRVYLAYYGNAETIRAEEPDGSLRRQYGIKDDETLVAMVSYFYKPKKHMGQTRGLKGHEDFIDAVSLALEKNPKIRPMIIGNAWDGSEQYEQEVIKYAKNKLGDKVIFTGYRNDVKKIYSEIDIAVHPSHSENLGGAAESLALCVPTIATNIGGFPDIVRHLETGYLTEAKNPQKLCEAICYMTDNIDEARQMAQKGRKLTEEMLDINVTAKCVKDIYEDILNK